MLEVWEGLSKAPKSLIRNILTRKYGEGMFAEGDNLYNIPNDPRTSGIARTLGIMEVAEVMHKIEFLIHKQKSKRIIKFNRCFSFISGRQSNSKTINKFTNRHNKRYL